MPSVTTRLALPYPLSADAADVPADVLALANKLDPSTSVFLQGTAAARPAAGVQGRFHYATDTSILSWDTGSAWVAIAGPGAAPPLVSTLPTVGLVDGQEIYYQSTAGTAGTAGVGSGVQTMVDLGIVWHLRYHNTAAAYKWEFVGGGPLTAEIATDESYNAAGGTFRDITTQGPQVVAPLPGDYEVGVSHRAYMAATGNANMQNTVAVSGAPSGNTWTVFHYLGNTGAVTMGAQMANTRRVNVSAASSNVRTQYYVNSGTGHWVDRSIVLRPIRVG